MAFQPGSSPYAPIDPILPNGSNVPQSRIRDAGSGRGNLTPKAKRSLIFGMTPRARQAYLRSMGYSVKIDGKSGPQTASAGWAFVHGHGAEWYNHQSRDWQQSIWNQNFAKYHKPVAGDPGGAAPSSGKGRVLANDNNQVPADPSNSQFSSSALGQDLGAGIAQLYKLAGAGTLVDSNIANKMGTMIDPNAAGSAAAEAAYGQALRDAERAMADLPGQNKQHQVDLTNWYGQAGARQSKGAAEEAAMADSLISSSQGASAGVINALGGSANPSAGDLGAAGENETAALRAQKLAAASGNADMAAAIGSDAASAHSRQAILDQNALVDAQRTLEDTRAKSGASKTDAMNQAIAANNALAQARLQAKMGIIGQNNTLQDSRAQRLAATIAAEEGVAQLGPNIDYKSAQAWKATHPTGTNPSLPKNAPKGAWVNLNGSQRNKIASDAHTTVQSMIAAKASVSDIVSRVTNIYRAQGLHPAKNPDVAQAIVGALQASGIKVDPSWAIAKWAGLGRRK